MPGLLDIKNVSCTCSIHGEAKKIICLVQETRPTLFFIADPSHFFSRFFHMIFFRCETIMVEFFVSVRKSCADSDFLLFVAKWYFLLWKQHGDAKSEFTGQFVCNQIAEM
jgi:hypothetical protein